MIPIPSFLINFVVAFIWVLRIGFGWVENTIFGGGGGGAGGGSAGGGVVSGGGGGVVVVVAGDDLPVSVPLLSLLLPEDVLIEILARLPVISLLRFKSVSKSWRDLIQTSFFIDLHTTNTFFNSSCSKQLGLGGNTFILQTYVSELYKLSAGCNGWYTSSGGNGWERERKMFMLSFGSGSGSSGGGGGDGDGDDQVVFKLDGLGFPPYYKVFPFTHRILMVGSCNGLICLHDSELRDVSLWNPATRQFRILPKSITIQEENEEEGIDEFLYDFVAFGFDVKTKDYKVVQISCFIPTGEWRPECTCRVQVYSLSTDSWRLLEGINSLPADPRKDNYSIDDRPGLYLNGSYFFTGKKCPPKLLSIEELNEQGELRNESLMFSFDFTKEIFTTIQLPDHDHRYSMRLTHLDDKIALFTTHIPSSGRSDNDHCDDDCGNYDIWVLNEQGGNESWAKLHSFRIEDRVARRWILPRGILNNGEFALIETKTFYPHDVFNELQCLKTKKPTKKPKKSCPIPHKVLNELHLLNLVTKEPKKSFPISHNVSTFCIYKHSLVSIIGGNGAAAAAANRVVGGAMCGC